MATAAQRPKNGSRFPFAIGERQRSSTIPLHPQRGHDSAILIEKVEGRVEAIRAKPRPDSAMLVDDFKCASTHRRQLPRRVIEPGRNRNQPG
jgi:hypothetical protein